MVIQYLGKQFFKITLGNLTLALNPLSQKSKSGLKPARFGADIALISLKHPDFDGISGVSFGEKEPFIIDGPGEYEVEGVFIKGFLNPVEYDGKKKINTIYTLSLEGMNLCFLGALGEAALPSLTREAIGDVDVLFVPIGGGDVLDPSSAHKFSRSFNPKIVIPMDYEGDKSKELKKFEEEAGDKGAQGVAKLTLRKKDLEGKEGEVVVLKSS
ncbi:MAG: MBL fold metallo-hydrolase [Candidatus Paceibacterota bacterium]